VVLLLYCIRVPPAGTPGRRGEPGLRRPHPPGADYVKREAAGGGPRSASAATVRWGLRGTAARRMHRAELAGRASEPVRGRRA